MAIIKVVPDVVSPATPSTLGAVYGSTDGSNSSAGLSLGYDAISSSYSTSIGNAANAFMRSVVIGNDAGNPAGGAASDTVVIGYGAKVYIDDSLNEADDAVAIGKEANSKYSGIALGSSAAAASESIAIGKFASTSDWDSTGIDATEAVVIGNYAGASGLASVVIGSNAGTYDNDAVAVGANSYAAIQGVSIGKSAAAGNYATAIGYGSFAGGTAVAIGLNSYTDIANQIVIGAGAGTAGQITRFTVPGMVIDWTQNPQTLTNNAQTSGYTLAATDNGAMINITTGGVTISTATAMTVGQNAVIFNNSGSNQTITQGSSVTMRLGGTTTTGNRTLAGYGLATIVCVASNTYVISGAGLT